MKYYLTTKTRSDSHTSTFADVGELTEAVVKCINGGYRESDKALSDCYVNNESKYYAVVQGIQIATVINGVEMG